jgi:hypothetical protein
VTASCVVVEACFLSCPFPAADGRLPLTTQALQCLLGTGGPRRRCLSFTCNLQLLLWSVTHTLTQLEDFAVSLKNYAVPVDFAVVGKLAETVFPDGPEQSHSKPKLSNVWMRKGVIDDIIPSRCNLYRVLCLPTQ